MEHQTTTTTKENQPLTKELSTESAATIRSLSELDAKVRELEDELHAYDAQISTTTPTIDIKHALAQLVGVADRVQFGQVDGVLTSELSSGKDAARHYRKAIHARIDAVRDHATDLHAKLDAAILRVVEDDDQGTNNTKDDDWHVVLEDSVGQTRDATATAASSSENNETSPSAAAAEEEDEVLPELFSTPNAEAPLAAATANNPAAEEAPKDATSPAAVTVAEQQDTFEAAPATASVTKEAAEETKETPAAAPAVDDDSSKAKAQDASNEASQQRGEEIKINVTRRTESDKTKKTTRELEAIRARLAEMDAHGAVIDAAREDLDAARAAIDAERAELFEAQRRAEEAANKARLEAEANAAKQRKVRRRGEMCAQPPVLLVRELPVFYRRAACAGMGPFAGCRPTRRVVYHRGDPLLDLFRPHFLF